MANLLLSCVDASIGKSGILPILNPKVNECDADLFSERKEKEKMTFDTKSKQLPVLFIGSSASYLNPDMKSWSIGTIHA